MKGWTLAGLLMATPVAAILAAPAAAQNWNANYERTEQGHRIGNPDADIAIVEFASYTCPHCASFERDAEAELRYFYIHEGTASFELRHYLFNIVDVAAVLVTECGPEENFFGNHRAMLLAQPEWRATLHGLSQAQQQRYANPDFGSAMRAIASDLDWYALMEPRGYTRTQLDQCLGDRDRASAIVAEAEANAAEFGINSTPSFVVDGTVLEEVHNWPLLRQALAAIRQGLPVESGE